jgi:hypothetical protein
MPLLLPKSARSGTVLVQVDDDNEDDDGEFDLSGDVGMLLSIQAL